MFDSADLMGAFYVVGVTLFLIIATTYRLTKRA